jgi:adenine phosphoribosyltransferase
MPQLQWVDCLIDFKQHITETPDFPKPGIVFRDFSPLLRSHFPETLDALAGLLGADDWHGIEAIVGVDARGFMLGAALAAHRGLGFVAIRKAGKLPPPVEGMSYKLEYGEATLEMHHGAGRVLLVDDILATGGTLAASAQLCRRAGYELAAIVVLADLGLRQGPIEGLPVRALLKYP